MSEITHWDGPPLEAWAGAWTPQEAAQALAGLDVPWCVVGGWAIDLFLGRVTRKHEDLEIAVPRMFFPAIRSHLERRYALHVVGDGEVRRMKAGSVLPPEKHQCWVLDEAANQWRLDVMSEPGDIVRGVNGVEIKRVGDLVRALNATNAWSLVVDRGGQRLTLNVQG